MDKSRDLELSSEPKRKELENENRISKEFISTCTLHGLHYIFNKRHYYLQLEKISPTWKDVIISN